MNGFIRVYGALRSGRIDDQQTTEHYTVANGYDLSDHVSFTRMQGIARTYNKGFLCACGATPDVNTAIAEMVDSFIESDGEEFLLVQDTPVGAPLADHMAQLWWIVAMDKKVVKKQKSL